MTRKVRVPVVVGVKVASVMSVSNCPPHDDEYEASHPLVDAQRASRFPKLFLSVSGVFTTTCPFVTPSRVATEVSKIGAARMMVTASPSARLCGL